MAWRIDEHVIRGVIDNRTRGRVVGQIWFAGRVEPVDLQLQGNCWRDLAGRRLEFVNPVPQPGLPERFSARQVGAVGDITASRKVKVLDFPPEDLPLYYKTGREMPWHWGNALHLEWLSEQHGRVVIETADFELKIIGEPAWEMTAAEEGAQRRANGAALEDFLKQFGKAADDAPAEGDERPETEAEAEERQARSDLLADRIAARLGREGGEADYERILDEEIERLRRERGEPELTPEQVARNAEWIEEMNRAAEEALANPDPELEAELDYEHPLALRTRELHLRLHETAKEGNWVPEDAGQEHPVQELLDATMIAGAKLAGALNGRYWPPEIDVCASVIVRLKKAREYLDDALRAMESCQEERLLTPAQLGPMLVEVIDIAHDVDALIAELRARLERGLE